MGRAGNSNFLNFPLSPLIFHVYFLARTNGERPWSEIFLPSHCLQVWNLYKMVLSFLRFKISICWHSLFSTKSQIVIPYRAFLIHKHILSILSPSNSMVYLLRLLLWVTREPFELRACYCVVERLKLLLFLFYFYIITLYKFPVVHRVILRMTRLHPAGQLLEQWPQSKSLEVTQTPQRRRLRRRLQRMGGVMSQKMSLTTTAK